jgi:2,3-bisphosphoglycerate-independent phosphoglycerate mutase
LADHGNSDVMINPDGTPNTQHSTNLVPFIVMDKDHTWNLKPGKTGGCSTYYFKSNGSANSGSNDREIF